MKLSIRLKGGEGSGHHGHTGLAGVHGGSLPAGAGTTTKPEKKWTGGVVGNISEIQTKRKYGRGWFITAKEQIVNITGEFGGGTNDHVGYAAASENPELLGISKETVDAFNKIDKALHEDDVWEWGTPEHDEATFKWQDAYEKLWDEIREYNIRVREWDVTDLSKGTKKFVSIQDLPINDQNLSIVKSWLGWALPAGNDVKYVWEDWEGMYNQEILEFTMTELLDAEDVGDLKRLQYKEYVEKQLPIDDKSKNILIDIRKAIFNSNAEDLAEQMFIGNISVGQWEEEMRRLIRELHTSSAAIGKGGWDQMSYAEWGRLGNPLKYQYSKLHGFAQTITDNADSISLKAIKARARMYGNASGHSASLIQAGHVIENMLPWIPKDGSTECLVNCRCLWELIVLDTIDDFKVVQATWRLRPAEHCADCMDRDGHVEIINVHKSVDVPSIIGGF